MYISAPLKSMFTFPYFFYVTFPQVLFLKIAHYIPCRFRRSYPLFLHRISRHMLYCLAELNFVPRCNAQISQHHPNTPHPTEVLLY